MSHHLAPHPWDLYGTPPPPGPTFDNEPLADWRCEHHSGTEQQLDPAFGVDVHVVPVGAGPYLAGILRGLNRAGRYGERVIGVAGMGVRPSLVDRVAYLAGYAMGLPPHVQLVEGGPPVATPWPSDPHYEWPAWPVAQQLAADGARVLFWSVGRPVA